MLKRLLSSAFLSCSLAMVMSGYGLAQSVDVTEKGGFLTTSFAAGGNAAERAGALIDNSSATKMYNGSITAGTTYIQFRALSPEVVTGYSITSANDSPDRDLAAWDFQGSADGVTWKSLDLQSGQTFPSRFQKKTYSFTNTTAYSYFRWYAIARQGGGTGSIQLSEIEILTPASANKINIMALGGSVKDTWNNTTNEGASSCVDSYIWKPSANNTTNASDGGTKYLTGHAWAAIVFKGNVKTIAQQYSITSGNDAPERDPKDWSLYASNDTTLGWTKLDAQTAQAFTFRCETKVFPITGNTTLYKYYKLEITTTAGGGNALQLAEWQLQGQMGEIPVAPSTLTAAPASTSSVKLTWSDNSTIEDNFSIEQSWDQANWYRVLSVPANTTSYTVTDLASNVKYFFRVRAIRTDVGNSGYSNTVSAQPTKGGPTYVDITEYPGILTEKNNSNGGEGRFCAIDNNINTKYSGAAVTWLQWKAESPAVVDKYTITSANDDPSSDPRDWTLQASNDGVNFVDLDTRAGETFATRFLLKTYTVANTASYSYYRFNFTTNNGSGGRTQMTEVELFGTSNGIGGLTAPTDLVAVALSSKKINISWSDNSMNEDGYKVERSTDGTNWSALASIALNSSSFTDSSVAALVTYYYRVAANSTTYGLSGYSNVSSAKTLNGGAGLNNLMALSIKGVVSALYEGNPGETIENLVDGDVTTKYNLLTAQAPPVWMQYDLGIYNGKPITAVATMYSVTSANDGSNGRDPLSWILQGSNDTVWTTLHTVEADSFAARMQTKEYTFTNTKAFSKYRITINSFISEAPNYVQLAEWAVYANPGSVTPVELTSFSASATRTGAQLNWKTATELQNHGFDIERSEAKLNKWIVVGFVAGNGTTTKPCSYSFTDSKLASGSYEYRLKQIDNDGTFKYSNVVEVEVGSVPREFTLSQNYPNPFNPTTNIDFTLAVDGRATVKVFNAIGAEVATLFDAPAVAGKLYQLNFNASHLSSGVYFTRIESGKQSVIRKIVLMK